MAKRSDFAQKLLDDLRVRKERMATTSQTSRSSKTIAAADAYTYSKQAYKGSREMKTHQTSGLKNGSKRHKSTGGNKSLSIGEVSKEMVPFGKGRSTEQFGDLSMALAFALENGGKLRRVDSSGSNNSSSILGFLNQIGRRQMDMGRSNIDRYNVKTTSRVPALSQLHVEEISRGAQRLNQILRACSNGLNFDRYSIEIGKELLKGAMDLEESLRMLVNLQEASEYMTTPRSRTRITLLDDDEDENDGIIENNQLARPRFSFDKPSRNSQYIQESALNDLKQRLIALTYSSETTHTSNSTSHRRSTSYSPSVNNFAAFSEHNYHSNSSKKPEKARISNVIAKLMGLEELPEKVDAKHVSKKGSSSKEKIEPTGMKKTSAGGGTMREQARKTKESATLASPGRKNKPVQPNQIQVTQGTVHSLRAERKTESFEGFNNAGKPLQKDVEGIKLLRSSNKANIKMDKHQNNFGNTGQSNGSCKQDDMKLREQKGRERGENKDLILKHQIHQMVPKADNGSEAVSILKGQVGRDFAMPRTERRDTKLLNNQSKPHSNLAFQQHYMLQKFEAQEKKHFAGERVTEAAASIRKGHVESDFNLPKSKGRDTKPSIHPPNSPRHPAFQQHHMLQRFESQDKKHYEGEIMQKNVQQKLQVKGQLGSESWSLSKPVQESPILPKKHELTSQAKESIHDMQFMGFPNKKHHGDLVQDKDYPNLNITMQDSSLNNSSTPNSPLRNLNSELIKGKGRTTIPADLEERPSHLPVVPKPTKVQKAEAPRRIDELATRRSANPPSLVRSSGHQTSILQEMKKKRQIKLSKSREEEQVMSSRSREAEARSLKSNETVSSKQQSNMLEESYSEAEQASNLCTPPVDDDDVQSLKGQEIQSPNENFSAAMNPQLSQDANFDIDRHRSHSVVSDKLNLADEKRTDVTHPSTPKNQTPSVLEEVEPLTESENHLKQILLKSQLFLNTAEALFKLNIPLNILHSDSNDCHDQESKLLLDCGYEVMKRKGRRQELSIHPFMKISITSLKIRSLDELIKHLHKDFHKLKFYGRNEKAENVVEDYLPRMLEIDVYYKDPDVNCMWDFGWHDMAFTSLEKDDVTRDVERHVFNALLDEITRDFLLVSA